MKTAKLLIGIVAIAIAFAFVVIQSVSWKIKDGYSVKYFGIKGGEGLFKGLKATISFDEAHPEKSKITASVDARTINTGNGSGDAHAREALGADKFPVITFVSTAIKKTGNGYEATGNLTLKGITKEIKLPFTFDSKKDQTDWFPPLFKETFHGKFTIVTKDFGMAGELTPEQVTVELNVPVTK